MPAPRKLTPTQVANLMAEYSTGKVTQVALAKKYGLSPSGVYRLIERQRAEAAKTGRPTEVRKCGTISGYVGHIKDGTLACSKCLDAWAKYHRALRKKKKEGAE